MAAYYGSTDALKLLISVPNIDLKRRTNVDTGGFVLNDTALSLAVEHPETVALLLGCATWSKEEVQTAFEVQKLK